MATSTDDVFHNLAAQFSQACLAAQGQQAGALWVRLPHKSAGVAFIQVQNLTGGDVFENLLLAPWPLDLQAPGNGLRTQSDIEPHVAGAQVAAGRIDLTILRHAAGGEPHLRSKAEAVALPAQIGRASCRER